MSPPLLRIAGPDDAAALSRLGWETFLETFVGGFGVVYPQADLDTFFADAYAPTVCAAQLGEPATRVWFAEHAGASLGFAQVGAVSLPHPEVAPGDGELKRLYLRREAQGTGVGPRLMDAALAHLDRNGRRPVWLSVWSGNTRAQRFYALYGFEIVGRYLFPVGETRDDEFIMRRP